MKKKEVKKIPTRYFHENLFNIDFVLVLCEWKEFLQEAKNIVSEDKFSSLKEMVEKHGEDVWCQATQFPFGGGGSIIWSKPENELGTLVHEITHAVHHALKARSVPLSEDTEEVYAYMMESVFRGILEK